MVGVPKPTDEILLIMIKLCNYGCLFVCLPLRSSHFVIINNKSRYWDKKLIDNFWLFFFGRETKQPNAQTDIHRPDGTRIGRSKRTSPRPKFLHFHFHAVFEKQSGPIWHPPLGFFAPPLRNPRSATDKGKQKSSLTKTTDNLVVF